MIEQIFGTCRCRYDKLALAIIFYESKVDNFSEHMLLYNADAIRGMSIHGIVWLRKPTEYEQKTIYPALIVGGWEYLKEEWDKEYYQPKYPND